MAGALAVLLMVLLAWASPASGQSSAGPGAARRPDLVPQTGHARRIAAIAVSAARRLVVTGSDDFSVRLWDADTGLELRALLGHEARVRAVSVTADGRLVASASEDSTVRVWNVDSGVLRGRVEGRTEAIAFSPDGARLAAVGGDATLQVWSSATLARGLSVALPVNGRALAWSPDGATLATGDRGGSVRLWDSQTGAAGRELTCQGQPILSIAFSPRDDVVVAIDDKGGICRWESRTGHALPGQAGGGGASAETAVAFAPDGTRVATLSVDAVSVWDARAMRVLGAIRRTSTLDRALAFDPAGGEVLVAGPEATALARWSPPGTEYRPWPGARLHQPDLVAVSPDGRLLCIVSSERRVETTDGAWVHTWELATGVQLGAFRLGRFDVRAAAFTPDGRLLLVDRRRLRVIDPRTGAPVQHEMPIADGETLGPAGGTVLTMRQDGAVALIDPATRAVRHRFQTPPRSLSHIALDWSGTRVALRAAASDRVEVWETVTGAQVRVLPVGTDLVTALAFAPAGDRLAVGLWDGTIQVWDLATERRVATLTGHGSRVLSMAYARHGRQLWSVSEDGTTRLWDAAGAAQLASLLIYRDGSAWLAATPDGLFDGPPPALARLVWRFDNDTFDVAPAEAFVREFYAPGLLADVVAGRPVNAPRRMADLDRRPPRVTLAQRDATTGGPVIAAGSITLRVTVAEAAPDERHRAGGGARDVRLFRNGALIKGWRGEALGPAGAARPLEVTVPLVAGENRFTAYAFNGDGVKSRDASLVLRGAETLRRAGTAWILAVGVDHFADRALDLRFAGPDATAFARELAAGLRAGGVFGAVEVVTLLDAEATRTNILAALRRLAGTPLPPGAPEALQRLRRAAPEDAVVVFVASRGTAAQEHFYLLPHDVMTGAASAEARLPALLGASISDQDLEAALEPVDAGHFLLIIDACNSGEALQAGEKRRGPMNVRGLARLAYDKGIDILTAAQGRQPALEAARLGHGLLSHALVEEGLRRRAADLAPADGVVDVREWLDYAAARVPGLHAEMVGTARSAGDTAGAERMERWDVQRPRVFYRREPDPQPLAVTPRAQP